MFTRKNGQYAVKLMKDSSGGMDMTGSYDMQSEPTLLQSQTTPCSTEKNMVYIAYDNSLKHNVSILSSSQLSASDSLADLPPIPSPKNRHNALNKEASNQGRIKKRFSKQKHCIQIPSEYSTADPLPHSSVTLSPSYGYFDKLDISAAQRSKSTQSALSRQLSQCTYPKKRKCQQKRRKKNKYLSHSSKSLMTNIDVTETKKKRCTKTNSHRALMAERCKKLFDQSRQKYKSMTPTPKKKKKKGKKDQKRQRHHIRGMTMNMRLNLRMDSCL